MPKAFFPFLIASRRPFFGLTLLPCSAAAILSTLAHARILDASAYTPCALALILAQILAGAFLLRRESRRLKSAGLEGETQYELLAVLRDL
ncbi:MAG: hypothetical protein HQL31_07475, partial [Planctomycetes bacterium]|nr:hypothetical protein [Planctomycetota bacterium]